MTRPDRDGVSGEGDIPYPSWLLGWYVTGLLVLAYMLSYVDRTMLALMVDPVKRSLGVSDLQVSLLQGLAFAIFYTVLGLPMGRIADRRNRRNLIVGGIALWSVMTSLCGFANNFLQLFVARIGVGVGEATLSPAAYSILSDYFPPQKRARVLGVYTSGIYLGAALATFGGGWLLSSITLPTHLAWLGTRAPWQIVFMLIGLLGLPLAAVLATMPEPRRRGTAAADAEHPSYSAVFAFLWTRRRAYGGLITGTAAYALVTNGLKGWIPTYLMRLYHWTPATVGLWFGLILLVFGTTGTAAGGFLSAALRKRGYVDSNMRVAIAAAAVLLPLGIAAPLMPTATLSLVIYCAVIWLAGVPFGIAAAAIQDITPNHMRGQVSAIYLFFLNLAGIGTGPMVVALFTDKLFGRPDSVGLSLACLVAIGAPLTIALMWSSLGAYRQAAANEPG